MRYGITERTPSRLILSARVLALCAAVAASGCGITRDSFGPPYFDGNLRQFGGAYGAVRTEYIVPVAPRDIIRFAITGLGKAPGLPEPQASQIVADALRQLATLPVGGERAMRDRFSSTFASLRSLPGAPSDTTLLQAGTSGLAAGLDKDSGFVTPGEASPGPQASVGLAITKKDDGFRITVAFLPSPAAEAGVQTGDVLTAVDGHPVNGSTLSDIFRSLGGADGSEVALSVQRSGQPLSIKVVRHPIKPDPVSGAIVDRAIYVRPSPFLDRTAEQMRERLHELQRAQPGATGVILDLRDNPGGLWNEVYGVASAFLPPDTPIADVRARRHEEDQHRVSRGGDVTHGLPLVVLADGETGSGAEVVAAALQASHRATVLGRPTLGTGAIATVFPLGGLGYLRLTTGRIILANGKPLAGSPVLPDAGLPTAAGTSPAVGDRFLAPERPSLDLQVRAAATFLRSLPLNEKADRPAAGP